MQPQPKHVTTGHYRILRYQSSVEQYGKRSGYCDDGGKCKVGAMDPGPDFAVFVEGEEDGEVGQWAPEEGHQLLVVVSGWAEFGAEQPLSLELHFTNNSFIGLILNSLDL